MMIPSQLSLLSFPIMSYGKYSFKFQNTDSGFLFLSPF